MAVTATFPSLDQLQAPFDKFPAKPFTRQGLHIPQSLLNSWRWM